MVIAENSLIDELPPIESIMQNARSGDMTSTSLNAIFFVLSVASTTQRGVVSVV
jgi:hypothetical protein